jgi:DNA-directed RNA polymerase subunit RPC12/RpoP
MDKKCQKCGVEMDYIIEDRVQRAYYSVANGDYSFDEYGDILNTRYYCPNCDKQLTSEEQINLFTEENF